VTAAERRVRAILLDAAAAAYRTRERTVDDPDAVCGCGHCLDEHSGEEWDGPCAVAGCGCEGWVCFLACAT
jgi:hypothetical protein